MVNIDELKKWATERWTMDDIYGPPHWQRVEANGIMLYNALLRSAQEECNDTQVDPETLEEVDLTVIRCFAYLHDAGRKSDFDDFHGLRSAEIAKTIRNTILKDLTDEQFEKLLFACQRHTRTHDTGDLTIDLCFDANRLDLPRKDYIPHPTQMATEIGWAFAKADTNKSNKYNIVAGLIKQVKRSCPDMIAVMANAAAFLHKEFNFWWTGFFRVANDEQLILGPFQGPPACMQIKFGEEVCGAAWKEGKPLVVPDLEKFPGHIAGSSKAKSEIVVPLWENNKIIAVLDINSDKLLTFNETDKTWLETLCEYITE